MSVPVLDVRGVSRLYPLPQRTLFGAPPSFAAVSDISFTLADGECLAIVGESGCGKSTLARLIAGLDQPSAGSILWGPMPPDTVRVQMVFQDPYGSFNPRRKIGWSLLEPLHHSPLSPAARLARLAELLSEVGLPADVAERYPHQFSGGQRQRLALARALMPRPRLLIADEPTSALDLSVQAQILALLGELRTRHKLALLLISHNLAAVRAVADRMMVMAEGKSVEQGLSRDILKHPQHFITQKLFEAELALPDLILFS